MTAERTRYTESWLLSLLGHGAIVALSMAFVSTLHSLPEREPFRWDVALVDAPTSQTIAEAEPTPEPTVQPPPPQPPPMKRQSVQRPTPPKPVEAVVQHPPPPPTPVASAPSVDPITPAAEPEQAPFPTFEAVKPSEPA
ncbi:MAG TPA: hypothetical protein VFA38_08615, partial [Nitrospirales bacterium]|nr:hypothetical protein [Nitrospirales bacterium]